MGFLFVKNGFQTVLPKLGTETLKRVPKPVHWGCKGVKSPYFYLKSQGYGICVFNG
jgi:hypothetical protein